MTSFNLFVFFILCLFSTFASAEQTRLELLSSNVPYFSQVNSDDSQAAPGGFSIMLAQEITEEAGMTLNAKSVPWARLIRKVHFDSHILATGVVRTPEREEQFYWITPITYNPIGLYGKSGAKSANAWQNIESVSVLRGDYREDIVKRRKISTILSSNDWEQAIKAVLKGRVDAVFYSGFGIQLSCQSGGLICEKISLLQREHTAVSYIAMSKKAANARIAEKLQKAATRVKQSPEFNRTMMEWLEANSFLRDHSRYTAGTIVFDGALTTEFSQAELSPVE